MTFPTPRSIFLVSSVILGSVALLAGCDDSTDGSGGTSSSTGAGMTTSTTGTAMTTGSSMSTGSGVTMSEWDAYCEARGTLGCMGFDVAACKMQRVCATGFLRDDIEKDLLTCLQQGCMSDNCLAVGAAKPLSAVGMEFQTACNTYTTNCPGVSDDACSYPILLTDAELSKALPCLSMGNCPTKETCLGDYADTLNTCESWL